ncbi:MFS transporter [Salipiger pacificus]|nr:MFS transporter [Alloyangia pacifica]MCA0946177.1 MFS transporter [Alloyangia pacifica]
MVSALGVVQIFAWGSSYYLMAPLAGAIAEETGWGQALISAGVSVGLLMSGLAAPGVGRWIGRSGGRTTLCIGMALIAAGLILLSLSHAVWLYLISWGILGLGMAAGLYDAAFSVLGAAYGRTARSAITQLTLWGGFASTVCWPLSAWLVESVGWRSTCLVYAAVHLFGTLPLCWWALPRASGLREPSQSAPGRTSPMPVRTVDFRFLCIVAAGVTLTLLATIWSIHMVTILTSQGYTLAAAIAVGTLIGPSQVGARVLEMIGGGRHHPIWTMLAATLLVLVGFIGLNLGVPAAAALVAYGSGNGLWSIARGALPLVLYGQEKYATLMGRLARPMLLAGAAAPTLGALLIDRFGAETTMALLSTAAVLPLAMAVLLYVDVMRTRGICGSG